MSPPTMRETQVIEPIEILREIKLFPREFFCSHRPRQIWPKTHTSGG